MSNAMRIFAAAAALATAAAAQAPANRTPLLEANFPDPFVVPQPGRYLAYATNADGRPRVNVQLAHSPDGRAWTLAGDAMPTLPKWVLRTRPDIWAPEVVRVGNRWVLYFSGRHGSVRRRDGPTLCIGAAVAADPAGPFVPQEKPLLCEGFPHGVIDATVFPDGGRLWMIAKTDGNCCNVPTRFVTVPLAADGLSLAGAPTPIAGIAADQPWEGSVVEAPTMLRHQGALYLFYSANHFGGGSYGVGYARCESVTGPCTDAPENPILSSASARVGPLVGPGHQSVFEAGGRTMIAYHGWVATRGWRKARGTSARALFIDEIRWANGRPVIHRAP